MMNRKNEINYLISSRALCTLGLCFCCAFSSACAARDTVISFENMDTTEDIQDEGNVVAEDESEMIYVHICGAVCNPGLVELEKGSRVNDAVEKAGGFLEEADCDYINLAKLLEDGDKIYIPLEGEEVSGDDRGDDGLVDINRCSQQELMLLPGIGEAKAADIIAYRESNGGFSTPDEIKNVPGIKDYIYNKIKDRITIR